MIRLKLATVALGVTVSMTAAPTLAGQPAATRHASAPPAPTATGRPGEPTSAGRPDQSATGYLDAHRGPTGEELSTARILLGRSVEGRPIWAYRKGNPRATRRVVVVGQMHGDEAAGVRTARYIRNRVPVAADSVVWLVPTMNPDGLAADTRRNARGVDLNRNWPTNWTPGDGGGTRALSEPETKAMFGFLRRVQPRFVVSLHQPFGVVSRSDKNMRFVRRLSRQLDLPIQRVQIGDCRGADCPPVPTMTSWYNTRQPGYCVTVEFAPHPTARFLTTKAGPGILRATHSWRRTGSLP